MAIGEPVSSVSGLSSGIQWQDLITQLVQIEASRRVAPLNQTIDLQNRRSSAWSSFSSLVAKLQTSAEALADSNAFGEFQVGVPDSPTTETTLLGASATSSASPGSYQVEVQNLAAAGKMGSAQVTDTDAALGYSGTFAINGHAVTIDAVDSLEDVRDKINAANSGSTPSGVTAGIVSVGATESYLTLTADNTGSRGIELVDSASTGGVLSSLGLLDTSTTVANTAPDDATVYQSQRFSSETTTIATLLGVTVPPTTANILVQGVTVSIDLLSDSLQEVLDKIRAADPTATFVDEEVNGDTFTRISAKGVAVDSTDPNSQRTLELLGFLKADPVNSIASGTDATIVMDGYTIQRRTNSISDVVAGVTLNLQNAEAGTTVDVKVSRDLDAIVDKVKSYVDAYNAAASFVATQRGDPTAPLYSDGSLRSMLASLKSTFLGDVSGVDPTNPYTRPALVGVSLDRDGHLTVDEDALREALSTNFDDVAAMFGTSGATSSSDLVYVTGSADTAAGDYSVEITRAATIASHADVFADATTAAATYTDNGTNANEMTVADAYTGYSGTITLSTGDDVSDVVSKLNQMFAANDMTLTASAVGGSLSITGTKYGSVAGFDVSFSRGGTPVAASPIGYATGTYTGVDVQGRIYETGGTPGAIVTGVGQMLTGEADTDADGLAVRYTGSATGVVGDLSYVLGAAGQMAAVAEGLSRANDGVIALHVTTIDEAVSNLNSRVTEEQARLDRYKMNLVKQFTAMETALSQIQAQGSWLMSQIGGLAAN